MIQSAGPFKAAGFFAFNKINSRYYRKGSVKPFLISFNFDPNEAEQHIFQMANLNSSGLANNRANTLSTRKIFTLSDFFFSAAKYLLQNFDNELFTWHPGFPAFLVN
jgi:hypothetical protein